MIWGIKYIDEVRFPLRYKRLVLGIYFCIETGKRLLGRVCSKRNYHTDQIDIHILSNPWVPESLTRHQLIPNGLSGLNDHPDGVHQQLSIHIAYGTLCVGVYFTEASWRHVAIGILVFISQGNGLLPDSTKPSTGGECWILIKGCCGFQLEYF